MLDNNPLEWYTRPRVVCLCGSTKFKEGFMEANYRETMAGRIVLSVGFFAHADAALKPMLTMEQKEALDNLHFRKIDLADEILVINVGGYIGESTTREIQYAHLKGKFVRFLESVPPDKLDGLFRCEDSCGPLED